jgi:hypothetical protein
MWRRLPLPRSWNTHSRSPSMTGGTFASNQDSVRLSCFVPLSGGPRLPEASSPPSVSTAPRRNKLVCTVGVGCDSTSPCAGIKLAPIAPFSSIGRPPHILVVGTEPPPLRRERTGSSAHANTPIQHRCAVGSGRGGSPVGTRSFCGTIGRKG